MPNLQLTVTKCQAYGSREDTRYATTAYKTMIHRLYDDDDDEIQYTLATNCTTTNRCQCQSYSYSNADIYSPLTAYEEVSLDAKFHAGNQQPNH